MTRLPVAVVGVGYLGKEHARILSSLPEVELVGVVDANRSQAETVARACGTQALTDARQLPDRLRAAVIAAPTAHHHAVSRDLLGRGVSLLIEKPLTNNLVQAQDLVDLAAERDALIQVGHIERYNPAFEELQALPIRPCYLSAERCGGFTGRSTDVGAVLDLMIHDLDLVLALVKAPVDRVEALGVAVLGGHEDLARARVTFANGCIADLTASRVHPEARRQMHVWGPEGYAGVDFARRSLTLIQPGEGLRRGLDSRRLDPALAAGLKADLFNGYLETRTIDCSQRYASDQLTRELQEFVACVRQRKMPRVDGVAGLEAVALAARVLQSIATHAWTGQEDGPTGPRQAPAPSGLLFAPVLASREAA